MDCPGRAACGVVIERTLNIGEVALMRDGDVESSAIDLPKIGLFWLHSLRSPAANQNTAHRLLPPDLVALDLTHCISDCSGTSLF